MGTQTAKHQIPNVDIFDLTQQSENEKYLDVKDSTSPLNSTLNTFENVNNCYYSDLVKILLLNCCLQLTKLI